MGAPLPDPASLDAKRRVANQRPKDDPAGDHRIAVGGNIHEEFKILDEVCLQLASFEFDPVGFVKWAYPWRQKGTELENETGPDQWQRQVLEEIARRLREGGNDGAVVQIGVRSGHGVGKSALTAWIVHWAISTRELTRGVVTAMTETQLRTKTWPELARWHNMFVAQKLFNLSATSIKTADVSTEKQWRIDAVPWSEKQPAAFAGLHNRGRRVLLIMDEASEIHDEIWRVSEGAMTDSGTQIIWCAFGNPTRSTGRFYDIFAGKSDRWFHLTVDSRTSRFSNKMLIDAWAKEYGEDSDFFRVRVRGLPPRAGYSGVIAPDDVREARNRVLKPADYAMYPVVMALDPAEFGDNLSVLTIRQGPKVHKQMSWSGLDGIDLAARVVDEKAKWPTCQQVIVEATGIGAAVCAALRRIPGFPLAEFNPAQEASDPKVYANMRAELWMRMRDAIRFSQLPDDDRLQEQLCSVNYGMDARMRYIIESKKDMKRRGVESPDFADSLAMTYLADTIAALSTSRRFKALPRKQVMNVW
ncbi:MAG: hypothetical protein NZ553_17095 [Caldilinea sp.]|nr:hypothetical protein [Caldilinea sp.]MDW8442198.1 hypothetical protein [Caldilineaceae bacterium]